MLSKLFYLRFFIFSVGIYAVLPPVGNSKPRERTLQELEKISGPLDAHVPVARLYRIEKTAACISVVFSAFDHDSAKLYSKVLLVVMKDGGSKKIRTWQKTKEPGVFTACVASDTAKLRKMDSIVLKVVDQADRKAQDKISSQDIGTFLGQIEDSGY
jgi:hypothetical protein